jgi:ribonuclease PH
MDGVLTKDELLKLIENAKRNCEKIYGMQKDVIKKKYMG